MTDAHFGTGVPASDPRHQPRAAFRRQSICQSSQSACGSVACSASPAVVLSTNAREVYDFALCLNAIAQFEPQGVGQR